MLVDAVVGRIDDFGGERIRQAVKVGGGLLNDRQKPRKL